MSNSSKTPNRRTVLKEALQKIEELQAKLKIVEQAGQMPIAIVGVGCRFPGGVTGPESYWHLLKSGVDAITEVPKDRWDVNAYYDPDSEAPGKTYSRFGGYLADIDKFDPQFFGISPREVVNMDPQHRLFLEVAWEALENAGQAPGKLHKSHTGVYAGVTNTEYMQLQVKRQNVRQINAYTVSGNVNNVVSGRVAHFLGLHGPAISVDTACSSSLVALHLAVQGLRSGDCTMALAGGVNVSLVPETYVSFSKWGMFSPDGRCRTFDADASGFVRSEGCGVVVLKPLENAIANHDQILAVIRGTGANQDGPSSGISVPNGLAQQDVIRRALQNAGVTPDQISYVETHGTGTTLGDPIEVEALGAVYSDGHSKENPLAIGSVKTNLGHMESASGVGGLIKTVLALYHQQIPPHLHLKKLSPQVDWQKWPINVPTELTPWPQGDRPRFAGVSSFGFSGTNVHVILQEPPAPMANQRQVQDLSERPVYVLPVSARDENTLHELAENYRDYLAHPSAPDLGDICYTAGSGRNHFNQRLAVVATSSQQMQERLSGFLAAEDAPTILQGTTRGVRRSKIAFLYAGQGYQYAGMGQQLFNTQPTFRDALKKCDDLFRPYLKTALLAVLYPELHHDEQNDSEKLIDRTAYTQPAIFSLQYALTELWRSWGIEPSVVVGHSLGEFMAAHVAGCYSLEDGVKLVAERGRITDDLPGVGMMASLQAGQGQVEEALQPYGDNISIAAINGPDSIVVSGITEDVEDLLRKFEDRGVNVRRLSISNAFHSPFIEPALEHYERVASEVHFKAPRIRLISTLTGEALSSEKVPDAGYWRRHLREPVQFYSAMTTLRDMGYKHFLEIGPHPTLLGMGKRCFPDDESLSWIPSLRRDREDWQQVGESVAELYVRGIEVDWEAYDRLYQRQRVGLPTYPFQRTRFWIDEKKSGAHPHREFKGHPFITQMNRSPLVPQILVESRIGTEAYPYFEDHKVHGHVVLPLTGHLEIIVAGINAAYGNHRPELQDVVMQEPLIFAEGREQIMQLVVQKEEAGVIMFKLISLTEKAGQLSDEWQLHVTGSVGLRKEKVADDTKTALAEARSRCQEKIVIDEYYAGLERRGLAFGPRFRGLAALWRRDGESLAQIQLPKELRWELKDYHMHPALLDACLQLFVAAWPDNGHGVSQDQTYLPLNLGSYQLYDRPTERLWSHIRLRTPEKKNQETFIGDVSIYNEDDGLVAEIRGLLIKRTTAEAIQRALREDISDWLYEVAWVPKHIPSKEITRATPDYLPAPAELAKAASAKLAQVRENRDLAAYESLIPELDSLSCQFVSAALMELGWAPVQGDTIKMPNLARDLNILEKHHRLFRRMLAILTEDGTLKKVKQGWQVAHIPKTEDLEKQLSLLLQQYPACDAELTLLSRCGPQLAGVLRGETDPLQLLFPAGSQDLLEKVYKDSPLCQSLNNLLERAVEMIADTIPQDRPIRILEIGAGTGGTTAYILPKLPPARTEYTFTDMSLAFLTNAKKKFSDYAFLSYEILDVERDPAEQDFQSHCFDVIIAANVLHATADLSNTMLHVKHLLAPNGMLLLIEGTDRQRWVDLTFGLTEGWWKFTDAALRPDYALLGKAEWTAFLKDQGFREATVIPSEGEHDQGGSALAQHGLILARGPVAEQNGASDGGGDSQRYLIFADASGQGQAVADALKKQAKSSILVKGGKKFRKANAWCFEIDPERPEDYLMLVQELHKDGHPEIHAVLHAWALDEDVNDEDSPEALEQTQQKGCASVLNLVQALVKESKKAPPRLWLATRGVQRVALDSHHAAVAQAPIWGLAKVIALEHPELQCTCVDLDPTANSSAELLVEEILAADGEDHIVFRVRQRWVGRMIRTTRSTLRPQDGEVSGPVQLQAGTKGLLDTLEFRPVERCAPGPREVEIQVKATGLNFRDLLNALDMYPGDAGPLGGECAGIVAAVGENVDRFKIGDAVMGIATGSFSTHVITNADLLVPKPDALSFVEAATIPSAYMTAFYGLIHLGKLTRGERVLIHSAAGGVGLAAVSLAQQAGAEIFATAGNPEKRAFLESLGIQRVMDSRSLTFAEEILQWTDGEGVNVVLNSLSGEFIPGSLSVLAKNGRFVELGKRNIWEPAKVAKFKEVGAYHVVDLATAAQEDSTLIRSQLEKLMAGNEAGNPKPLPLTVFDRSEIQAAFRTMQQAKHIGKIVIAQDTLMDGHARTVHKGMQGKAASSSSPQMLFDSEASYLITGGLRGLGLLTAAWMVERGARHLILVARGDASTEARERIVGLEAEGAEVFVVRGDVSVEEDLRAIFTHIEASMPRLRGVIHSAGVLDDGALMRQDWPRFRNVMAPKVTGSWLLHKLTSEMSLDFFVLYSSMSSMIGQQGQGNHAAANAFQDALVHYRRARGKPGLSIHWGAWSEIGAAAARGVDERITVKGLGSISPRKGLEVLEHVMLQDYTEVGVLPANWATFFSKTTANSISPFLSTVAPETGVKEKLSAREEKTTGQSEIWQLLKKTPVRQRRGLLSDYIRKQATRVLELDASQSLDPEQPLHEIGLDSLLSIELRNCIGAGLKVGTSLPVTLLFDYPTIASVTEYLMNEVLTFTKTESGTKEVAEPPAAPEKDAALWAELEQLNDEEAQALLINELGASGGSETAG